MKTVVLLGSYASKELEQSVKEHLTENKNVNLTYVGSFKDKDGKGVSKSKFIQSYITVN